MPFTWPGRGAAASDDDDDDSSTTSTRSGTSDSGDRSPRRTPQPDDGADDDHPHLPAGGLFAVDDGTGVDVAAGGGGGDDAAAPQPGAAREYDFREGAVPAGVETVGDTLLETQQDGSTILHLLPMAHLRLHFPQSGAGDDRAEPFIEQYTLTMDIKLSEQPYNGLSLFHCSGFPDLDGAEMGSGAVLSPMGTVGCFNREESEVMLRPGRWNRVSIVVGGSFAQSGTEYKARYMRTYINGERCMEISEPMWGYGPGSRFSVSSAGMLLFAGGPLQMPGGVAVRYVKFEPAARSDDEIRASKRVASIFDQFAKQLRTEGTRLLGSLALADMYKRPHPAWYDPAFLAMFGDAHLEGTGLGQESYHGLARILHYTFAHMLDEQHAWFADVLTDRELAPIKRSLATLERSVALFRQFELACKGPAQVVNFLKKKGKMLADLAPGDTIWVPAGRWRNAEDNPNMLLAIRRNPGSAKTWRVHVVNCGGGVTYHPAQAVPPKIKYKTVVAIDDVPDARISTDAWWVYTLTATCLGGGSGPQAFYDHLLPFLTESTWAHHAAEAEANPLLPYRSLPRSGQTIWRCMLDALIAEWAGAGVPLASCKYVLFNLRRQFLRFAMHDLAALSRRGIGDSDRTILRIAASQVTRRALRQAETFERVSHLRAALEDVEAMEQAIDAVPPTSSDNTRAQSVLELDAALDAKSKHHVHPLFDRLLRKEDTEGLVGPAVPVPGFVPIDFLQVPARADTFEEALTALRYCDKLCTLLSVQSHVVKNAHFLKAALIQHVFTCVVPVPLGKDAGRACIWTDTPMRYGVQLDIMILLVRIVEHFASSVLGITTSKSFDAVRIVATGVMAAIADCVMRKKSTDHPSEVCMAMLERGFGIGLGQFGPQSETIEVTAAEVHFARTGVIDYFSRTRDSYGEAGPATTVFSWEKGLQPDAGLAAFLDAVGTQVAFPASLVEYMTDSHALIIKNYPEFACYRDICFYWKFFMNTEGFPGTARYKQRDAELQWGFDQMNGVFVVQAFGGSLPTRAKGHRWASGALASRYTAPVMVHTEDDLLHIHSFKVFDKVLTQQDIELLLSFLLVPYMRVPLTLHFFATSDRINALKDRQLRALLDSVVFEPSRYLPLNSTHAPTLVPSEEPELIASSYGVLVNELHRSPDATIRAALSLVAQARKLDVGTVFSSTIGVILYIVRLASRVETAILTLLELDAGTHPMMSASLRDDVKLLPEARAVLQEGLTVLQDALRTGSNSCLNMIEAWQLECLARMKSSERDPALAASMAEHGDGLNLGSDDDDASDDEDDFAQDGTLGNELGDKAGAAPSGGSAVMDKHTRISCRLFAHVVLLHRNLRAHDLDPRSVGALQCAFHFLQARHTWNHGMLDIPENELFDTMQLQRRNVIAWLHASQTSLADANHTLEAIVRVSTTSGARVTGRDDVVRQWTCVQGDRHAGRFTVATRDVVVTEINTEAEFNDAVAKHDRVVVDFFATWCMPCQLMGPVLAALSQHYTSVAFLKVDCDKLPDLAKRHGVKAMPTFIGFVARSEYSRVEGADPTELRALVDVVSNADLPNSAAEMAAAAPASTDCAKFGEGVSPQARLQEEVNLQTHLVTLQASHLRALDESVQADPDVQTVFNNSQVPMQAAVVQSAQHRDHYRLVGRYHDVQFWKTPDPMVPVQECDREYDPGAMGRWEGWVVELFEPVRQAFFNNPMEPVEIDMPEAELTESAGVAYLVAIHPKRGGTWKEIFCFKHLRCVHVYSTVSYGRRHYRTLEYTTDTRFTLREMQPVLADRQSPWPTWCRHGAGDPTADYPPGIGAVILRDAHVALGNISGGQEQYIPTRLLYGTVPQALLDTHRFWQGSQDNLIGYPVDAEATPNYIMVTLRERCFFPTVQTAPNPTVAQIVSVPFSARQQQPAAAPTGDQAPMQLVNALYAEPGSALFSLLHTLTRIETAGHILVWSNDMRPPALAPPHELKIASVQLPRLKLTFAPRTGLDGVERMYCVDHASLFITNERPTPLLDHIRGIPHSLLLSTIDREYTVLVPSVRFIRPFINSSPFSCEVVLDRNTPDGVAWRMACATPYYLYTAHISQSFLVAPALASALYLLLLRFSYRRYTDVVRLVDMIATDVDFEKEEEEATIFNHLVAFSNDRHPDAHACRLKINVAMLDSPVPTPWFIDFETADFTLKCAHVTAACQLSVHEQQQCLEESDVVQRMLRVVAGVVKAYGRERVMKILSAQANFEAQLERGFSDKRRADLFFEEIRSKLYTEVHRRLRESAILVLIKRVLSGKVLSEYRSCLIKNLEQYAAAFVGKKQTAPVVVPAAGEETNWAVAMLQRCLGTGPNEFRLILLRDQFLHLKSLSSTGIIEAVMAMFSGRTDSQGGHTGYSWLFWYRLLTKGIALKLTGVEDQQAELGDFVRLGTRLFVDFSDTFLVSSLHFLARTVQLAAGAPKWKDTRKTKDNDVSCQVAEGDDTSPLDVLFQRLVRHLQGGAAQSRPPPRQDAFKKMPEPAMEVAVPDCDEHRMPVSTCFPHGDLVLPVTQSGANPVLFNTAKGSLDIALEPADAPLSAASMRAFFNAPLEVAFGGSGVVTFGKYADIAGGTATAVASELPFDVSQHPFAQSHVSKQMLQRFTDECGRYAAMRAVDVVPYFPGASDRDIDEAPESVAANVMAGLEALQQRLLDLRAHDRSAAEAFTEKALKISHHVPAAPPAQSEAPASGDHSQRMPALSGNDAMARLRFQLRRYCGLESKAWPEYLVAAMLSDVEGIEWRKLNPFIGDDDLESGRDAVLRTVLHANRVGHVNRVLLELRDLMKLSRALAVAAENHRAQPADADALRELRKLQASTKQKATATAVALTQRRYHAVVSDDGLRATVDPRFVVFEFTWNLLLREAQVTMVRSFMAELNAGRSSVWQMIMGAGKTTVVGPLLTLLLATGRQLVMQVVPPALLEFSRGVMRTTFSSVIRKRVYTFTYDRSTECDPTLYRKLVTAQRTAGVVVANPTSVKSLQLKYIEHLTTMADPTRPRPPEIEEHVRELSKILHLFRGGVLILDEVDLILHPLKSELNFPIGPKEPLDFSPLRWLMAIHVIDAVFYAEKGTIAVDFHDSSLAKEALEEIAAVIRRGYACKALQRNPHLVLLDADFYRAELLPPMAQWLALWMEKHSFSGLPRRDLLQFLQYGPNHDGGWLRELLNQPGVTVRSRQMAILAHDWLTSYLPHVLTKIDRVTFGIMTAADRRRALAATPNMPRSRCLLAIPFVGKDVPSDASEFAHPDIIIGLSVLAYRYEGLRFSDFRAVVSSLRDTVLKETGRWADRKTNRLYEGWVKEAGGVIRGAVDYAALAQQQLERAQNTGGMAAARTVSSDGAAVAGDGGADEPNAVASLRLLKQCSKDQVLELFQLLRKLPSLVHWYLSELVFPAHLRFQATKISSSGQDLGGDMLFPRRVGFSGTPSDLLPRELGRCNFEAGSDGAIINTLTDPAVVGFEMAVTDWTPRGLLARIAKAPGRRFHALIDTGALITGMSNLQVARFLLGRGLDGVDGVVFLDDSDRKMVLVRATGRVLRLEECGIPLERRFAFYDQVHTTGMDIRHTPHATAVLTLGKDMTFRDYAQGAYRMRGIAKGQTIHLVMPPEVHRLLVRQLTAAKATPAEAPGPGCDASAVDGVSVAPLLRDIAAWLVVNSMGSERLQFTQLCLQNLSNVYRKRGFREVLDKGELFVDTAAGSPVFKRDPHAAAALDLFHEPVRFDLETSCPPPRLFTDAVDELAREHASFMDSDTDKAVVTEIRAMVHGAVDDSHERAFNADMVREQEQEKEKMKEVVEERELEITQFKDQQYERDHEAPTPWMFAMLADADMMLDPEAGMGPRAQSDDAAPTLAAFYAADQFNLFARQPLQLPQYLKVSNNYFDKRWSGHRRVKNVVVTLDWVPDRAALQLRQQPHAAQPAHGQTLARTLELLDHDSSGITDGNPIVTRGNYQSLVDCNFELSRAGNEAATETDFTTQAVRQRMAGSALRTEDDGRFSVVLSLIEAETVRRIMHVSQGSEVVDGAAVDLRLNIVPADNALMDATVQSRNAPAYQRVVTAHAWRFIDCATHFSNAELNCVLKAVQLNRDYERRVWFEQIIGCKRRDQKGWDRTPVARVFSLADEYAVLHQRILGLRIKQLVKARELLPFDAFHLFDAGNVGALTPGNVLAGLRWLGLTPSHDDVLDFVSMAHPAEDGGVTYTEWLAMMQDPSAPAHNRDGDRVPLAVHMAQQSALEEDDRDDADKEEGSAPTSPLSSHRADTQTFDSCPSTSTHVAAAPRTPTNGGDDAAAAADGFTTTDRQLSAQLRVAEDHRLPPVDDEVLALRKKQRHERREELKRAQEQRQRESARELTRAVGAHRRTQRQKRGLQDNPSVNGTTLRWEFTTRHMPDDVTSIGLTEFRDGPGREASLFVAHDSCVVLPGGKYGCDWLNEGEGLDSVVYQWTFTAVVSLPCAGAHEGRVPVPPPPPQHMNPGPPTDGEDGEDSSSDDDDIAEDLRMLDEDADEEELAAVAQQLAAAKRGKRSSVEMEPEALADLMKLKARMRRSRPPAAGQRATAYYDPDSFEPGLGTPLLAISRQMGTAKAAVISVAQDGRVVLEGVERTDIIVDTPVEWRYSDGGTMKAYEQAEQGTIERAYRENPNGSCTLRIFDAGNFTLDFVKMKQRNLNSGAERPIARAQDTSGARMKPGKDHFVAVTCDAITGEVRTYVDGLMSARQFGPKHDGACLVSPLTVSGDHPLFLFGHPDERRLCGGTVRWCALQPGLVEGFLLREMHRQNTALTEWVCALCSTHNKQEAVVCRLCDSPRQEAARDSEVATGQRSEKWDCGCGFKGNDANAVTCSFCTMPKGHWDSM